MDQPTSSRQVDALRDLERELAQIPPTTYLAPPLPRRLLANAVVELRRLRIVANAPVGDIADLVEATEHVFGSDPIWRRVKTWCDRAESEAP